MEPGQNNSCDYQGSLVTQERRHGRSKQPWDTQRVFEGPGIGAGIRSRVGVRHVPLSELLNKLVASELHLERVEELGKGTVPWLLALVATKLSR